MKRTVYFQKIHDMAQKASNCRQFLEQNILTDIFRTEKQRFESEGEDAYGDGRKWTANNIYYKMFKVANLGKKMFINNKLELITSDKVMGLTGRLERALTKKNPDNKIEITKNKLKYICNVPYLAQHEEGQDGRPVREVFFAGKGQVKKWEEMLVKYLFS